ncbi:MAG: acyl-CoA desaturase [Bacteroidetes bacterium]|nr:MAG: acyl-CoA desaturase [Bacteroidota bacterium]
MLLLFFGPLSLIIFSGVTSTWLIYSLYILAGFGMAGIGMGIMHDAIHGSYSRNKWLNNLMANTINLIGSNKDMWRLQHNVLHHSFTNIEHYDDDINTPFFLRFSPHAKKNKLHRYQYLYAWIFYGLSTISWITGKDFINLVRFKKMGLIKDRKTYYKYFFKIALWKIIYFAFVLVTPLLMTPVSAGTIVGAFLVMQFVTGLCISIVFQTAHVMPNAEFPRPDEGGKMENERMAHQLLTTCNFSQKGSFLFWTLGGLTNQIEHHLFPQISHIHYRKLAPIVKQTAEEFGLPYNTNGSFVSAVIKHFKMLKVLGKLEVNQL